MESQQQESGMPLKVIMNGLQKKLTTKYGDGEAREMARIIFRNLKGWTPVDLAIRSDESVSRFICDKAISAVDRLMGDEPIQYIFGNTDFYGMNLKVTPDTLIPRPETAELVDLIVKDNKRKDLRVLDAGTGSGCIALALARNLPFPEVTAIDFSEKALEVAKENGRALKTGVKFIKADMLSLPGSLPGAPFDILVSNPPYIAESEKAAMEKNVLDHEPASALFVPDDDPLKFYKALILQAVDGLVRPGGSVWFEINPLFASQLMAVAADAKLENPQIIRDTDGKQRFFTAVIP